MITADNLSYGLLSGSTDTVHAPVGSMTPQKPGLLSVNAYFMKLHPETANRANRHGTEPRIHSSKLLKEQILFALPLHYEVLDSNRPRYGSHSGGIGKLLSFSAPNRNAR